MEGKMRLGGGLMWLLLMVLMLQLTTVYSDDVSGDDNKGVVQFDPVNILQVPDGTKHQVIWFTNYTGNVQRVYAFMDSQMEGEVTWYSDVKLGPPKTNLTTPDVDLQTITYHGYVNISALFVGYTNLNITLYDADNKTVGDGLMEMTVVISYQKLNNIFTLVLAVILAIVYFLMGATIDLKVVLGIAKKPIGPLVGLFCQYFIMPLISFGLGQLLFPDNDFTSQLMRLGLFLGGCCPGGGPSNMWTVLLGGSLDLSIMMTAVSTTFAFATVPLWVLTMGPLIIDSAAFVIPYTDITITVISLLIPCGLGVAMQVIFPKTVPYCNKSMTPISAFSILITFTFGIYAYLYVFTLFTWRMLVSGFFLPMLGYISGMVLALIFRMPLDRVIAISIETGIQNYNIAIVILTLTLQPPAGQLAAAMPCSSVIFTPGPLLILLISRLTYNKVKGQSFNVNTPTELRDTPKETSSVVEKEKNGKLGPEGGIDNPAADLKDM